MQIRANQDHRQQMDARRTIMRELYETGLFRTWYNNKPEGWELVSGIWSPLYIQIRHLPSFPELFVLVAKAMVSLIQSEAPEVNRLIGLSTAGVPLASAIGIFAGIPMAYTRKLEGVRRLEDLQSKRSEYAEHALIEGALENNDVIAVIDDVAAMLTSKDVALGQISLETQRRKLANVTVNSMLVVIDREQAKFDRDRFGDVELRSLIRLRSEGIGLLSGVASVRELEVIDQYLSDPLAFQDSRIRSQLEQEAKEHIASRVRAS